MTSGFLVAPALAALTAAIACGSTAPDTTPRITVTSPITNTTAAQGSRFEVPFVLTWSNQPPDSVTITIDSLPLDINLDLSEPATITGNTEHGSIGVEVGFPQPGSYPVRLLARGAGRQTASVSFTVAVTLTR